jgi:hypothetical protein
MKLLSLTIKLNGQDQKITAPSGVPTGGTDMLPKILQVGINIMFLIAILLSVIYFILGGISWITSQGDKQKIDSAKKKLTYAIIGLVIVFISFAIMHLVGGILGAGNLIGAPTSSPSANYYVCDSIAHTCSIGTGSSLYPDLDTCNKACASTTCGDEQNKRLNSGCTCGAVNSQSSCQINRKIVGLYDSNGQACMIDCCCPK